MSIQKVEQPRTARRVPEEQLVPKLARRLSHLNDPLFTQIQSKEDARTKDETVELVLDSLRPILARYKGYTQEEQRQLAEKVIALIQSDFDPTALKNQPKKEGDPRGTPREVYESQKQQASRTPPPPPMTSVTVRTRTKRGAKTVHPRPVQHDQEIVLHELDKLFREDAELKDALLSSSLNWDDERLKQLSAALRKQLNRSDLLRGYLKQAAGSLAARYERERQEAKQDPQPPALSPRKDPPAPQPKQVAATTTDRVPALFRQPREDPKKEPIDPVMMAKIERATKRLAEDPRLTTQQEE